MVDGMREWEMGYDGEGGGGGGRKWGGGGGGGGRVEGAVGAVMNYTRTWGILKKNIYMIHI